MPTSSDVNDFVDLDASRFDSPDPRRKLHYVWGNPGFYGNRVTYGPADYWSDSFASHERSKVSQVLELLAKRLTARPASRDVELRHYGVPLSELFKVASSEYTSISIDPKVMAGAPCIAGTRIPVYMILDSIEAEGSLEGAREGYPRLTVQQIKDAIGFAKVVVECPVEPGSQTAS